MSEINEESGVFGGVSFGNNTNGNIEENAGNVNMGQVQENTGNINNLEESFTVNAGTIRNTDLPVKQGMWQKFKAFWLQDIGWDADIKVELTPNQQKVEQEVNDFLHQEITWKSVHDFLFQEVTFGKKNK